MPFFALKFLSFLPFGNLLRGASGKLILILGIVLVIAFGIWKIRHDIFESAYNQIFAEQAVELVKQQKREYEKFQELASERERFLDERARSREELIIEIQRIQSIVDYSRPEDDGEVAPVLREVISHLRSLEEATKPKQKKPKKEPSLLDKLKDKVPSFRGETEKSDNSVIDKWKKRGQ